MSIKLEDFLPYYIGQKALLAKKCEPENKVIGEIVEISNNHSNHGRWIKANCGDVVTLVNCGTWEPLSTNMPFFFINEDIIQPILRQLSDMTEEEFRKLLPNLSPSISSPYYHGHIGWVDIEKHTLILENRLQTNTLLFNDGIVLMRAGYDVFGLINEGLAVDLKTIQP